jgi:hypothetical protein
MTQHRPTIRLTSIEEKARARDSRITLIQTKKLGLIKEKIKEKLGILEVKNRRLQIKLNRQVRLTQAATQVVVSWSVLLSCLAVAKELKFRHELRQVRMRRAQAYLRSLMWLCLAAGKFMLVLKRVRIKKSFRVLVRLWPFLARFLDVRRRLYIGKATRVIEAKLTTSLVRRLMTSWKVKVTSI